MQKKKNWEMGTRIYSQQKLHLSTVLKSKQTELKQSSVWERQKCFVMTKRLTTDRMEQRQWSGAAPEKLTRGKSEQVLDDPVDIPSFSVYLVSQSEI